ncbi:MAG: glycosyltransferase family 61 protein [Hyphomicrobiales bacterium]|nr:glycosyltransferase family 61 protein [Hyphomicrobiales bacterium]
MRVPDASRKVFRTLRGHVGLVLRRSRSSALRASGIALYPWLGSRAPLKGMDDSRAFAARTGADYTVLGQARSLQFGTPPSSFLAPETFILAIPNGRVLGGEGVVITPEHRILSDVSIAIALPDWRHPALKRPLLPKVTRIEGEAAVIASVFPRNYWHWMIDILPRIHLLERAGVLPHRLIVNAELPFQRETLSTIGVGADRLLSVDPDAQLEVERLIVPSLPEAFCTIVPETIGFLRERFLHADANLAPHRLIYLSRNDAARRRVVNEEDLFARLEPLGFERVVLGALSVAEQARVFASARMILAPHGAGCTNLVFATPGSTFLEFMPDNGHHVSFEMLTSLLGVKYGRIEYTGPVPAPPEVTADVDAIMFRVHAMLRDL